MFGVDKPVVAMELSNNSSICLACKKPGENGFEVMNLELPNKLYQIENEHDSIKTSRDLKIKCGTLTDNQLIDVITTYNLNICLLIFPLKINNLNFYYTYLDENSFWKI